MDSIGTIAYFSLLSIRILYVGHLRTLKLLTIYAFSTSSGYLQSTAPSLVSLCLLALKVDHFEKHLQMNNFTLWCSRAGMHRTVYWYLILQKLGMYGSLVMLASYSVHQYFQKNKKHHTHFSISINVMMQSGPYMTSNTIFHIFASVDHNKQEI